MDAFEVGLEVDGFVLVFEALALVFEALALVVDTGEVVASFVEVVVSSVEVVASSAEVVATAADTLMEIEVAFFFFCTLDILRRRGAMRLFRSSSKACLTGVSVNIAVFPFFRPLLVAFRAPALGNGRTATGLNGSSSCS